MTKKRNETKDISIFAGGIGVIASIFSTFSWWKGGHAYSYLLPIGTIFAAVGISMPHLIKPVYTAWMRIAGAIGRFQTKLLLILFFYLILTPIALLMRISGKDILDMSLDRSSKSYWKEKEAERDLGRYEKQF